MLPGNHDVGLLSAGVPEVDGIECPLFEPSEAVDHVPIAYDLVADSIGRLHCLRVD